MKTLSWVILGVMLSIVSVLPIAQAYGPLQATDAGEATRWAGNTPEVVIVPEKRGSCGSNSAATMLGMTEDLMAQYVDNDLSTLSVSVEDTDYIDEDGNTFTSDVGKDNCDQVLIACGGDINSLSDTGQNPLVWDDDPGLSGITMGAVGLPANTLGFTLPVTDTSTNTFARTEEVISCILNTTDEDLEATIIHEAGHNLGLDHSLANATFATDDNNANNQYVPLMYPTSLVGDQQTSLNWDDHMGIAYLYPATELETTTWTLKGTLLDSDNNELPCANMILRDTANEDQNVLTFVTATDAAFDDDGDEELTPDECESGCGDFMFIGLDPDKTYELSIEPIASDFSAYTSSGANGSSVGRCTSRDYSDDNVNEDVPDITITSATFNAAVSTTLTLTITCNDSDCDTPDVAQATTSGTTIEGLASSTEKAAGTGGGGIGSGSSSGSGGGCQLAPEF